MLTVSKPALVVGSRTPSRLPRQDQMAGRTRRMNQPPQTLSRSTASPTRRSLRLLSFRQGLHTVGFPKLWLVSSTDAELVAVVAVADVSNHHVEEAAICTFD